MSSTGIAPRDYSDASTQLALDPTAPSANEGIGDESDFYRTPAWCMRAILRHLPAFWTVIDPCAGDGAMLDAIRDVPRANRGGIPFAHVCGASLRGFEIDEKRFDVARAKHPGVRRADALAPETYWGFFDVATLNPPFSLAEEFVRRAIAEAAPQRATVAALLRTSFLESRERVDLHREHPADVFVFASRPSFVDKDAPRPCPRCMAGKQLHRGDVERGKCTKCSGKTWVKGGTDSASYMWAVWGPGRGGRWQIIDDVDPTKKVRVRMTAGEVCGG